MKNLFKLTLTLLVVFLFACKKDENTTKTNSTKDLITSGVWKVTGYSSTATDPFTAAVIKGWNDDLKAADLFVTYSANGSYMYSDGSEFGTWELSGDKTIIFEKGTADELTSTIDNITTNSLVITYPWEMSDSLTVNVTETASK
jgi:hypothetical protein